jgi:vesicle-fusing ATPase
MNYGPLNANAVIVFEKKEGSAVMLAGQSKGKATYHALLNPEWNFQDMGIGGLDKEFSDIIRRVFASRVFPQEFVEQLSKPLYTAL